MRGFGWFSATTTTRTRNMVQFGSEIWRIGKHSVSILVKRSLAEFDSRSSPRFRKMFTPQLSSRVRDRRRGI